MPRPLNAYLIGRGYREYPVGLMSDLYSALYQRRITDVPACDSNGHTEINVWIADVVDPTRPTLSVEISAEAEGLWYKLEAYGLPQTPEAVEAAEEHVKAAWRAIAGDK